MKQKTLKHLISNFLIVSFLVLSKIGFSQSINEQNKGFLIGKVIDSLNSKPIEYVQIKVLNDKDSITISGIYSNEKGEFELSGIPFGKYLVKVSFLGYSTKFFNSIEFNSNRVKIDLKSILLLTENEIGLSEVKILGKADVLKTGIDKKIYNV